MAAVTMKDIAKRAGVSYTTVSNVLTERWRTDARIKVRPDTVEKVLKCARGMGWVPNNLARNLVARRSRIFGALIGDLDYGFATELVRAAQWRLEESHYHLLPAFTRFEPERIVKAVDDLVSFQVSGVLCLLFVGVEAVEKELARRKLPRVWVDHYDARALHCVGSDDASGMGALVAHLVDARGYRRLAYVEPLLGREGESFRTRTQGLRWRTVEHEAGARGLAPDLFRFTPALAELEAAPIARWIRASRAPSALICFNDDVAASLALALHRLGLAYPGDYALTGYSDGPEIRYLAPSVTTVRQDVVAMGRQAAELLVDLVEGRGPLRKEILTPVDLVVRESVGKA
ncbi:MAG: LacI family DNA-binding transcriptional regulator [Spirochaetes bacterium]|nr:LacI family DNA-binding transcriptional regulator [Spirochaetota bacterium]